LDSLIEKSFLGNLIQRHYYWRHPKEILYPNYNAVKGITDEFYSYPQSSQQLLIYYTYLKQQERGKQHQKKEKLGAVAHTCNPSYLGGGDQQDCGLRPTWTKKFTRPYLNEKSWAWWYAPVIPTTQET
jgi:hypothetical protein